MKVNYSKANDRLQRDRFDNILTHWHSEQIRSRKSLSFRMDDCILSEPGGDGGGTTLTNVADAFQGMSNALNQVPHILHTVLSQKNAPRYVWQINRI